MRRIDGVTAIDNQVKVRELEFKVETGAGFGYADRLALLRVSALPLYSSQENGVCPTASYPVLDVQNDRNK